MGLKLNTNETIEHQRYCSVCKIQKDISEFGKQSAITRGYRYSCKKCHSKHVGENARKKRNEQKEALKNDAKKAIRAKFKEYFAERIK